ncbi:MAG: hypothetical protein AAGC65_07770 [Mucilaginibacter sp.]|uniref:hypothetical protein n=1 Tax=Mucilaginibacter sp. TaxID=1882438 RepID=UPI0031B0F44F
MEENEYPAFGFGIDYGDELVYCEVIMRDNSYDIQFNNQWIASIEHTEDFTWLQASGTILPQKLIDEIGAQIEHHYK